MIKYKHYCGPSYGGLFVKEQPLVRTQCVPYFPIREREKGYKGEVISQDEALDILVCADVSAQSRFKGAKLPAWNVVK